MTATAALARFHGLAERLDVLLSDGVPRTLSALCLALGRSRDDVNAAIAWHRRGTRLVDGVEQLLFDRPLIARPDSAGTWRYTTTANPIEVADYQDERGYDIATRVQTQLGIATKALALTAPGTPDWQRALDIRDRWVAWHASIRAALPA